MKLNLENLSSEQILALPDDQKEKALEILEELHRRKLENKVDDFVPYGWQRELVKSTNSYSDINVMAANRVGKTYSMAMILSIILTGRYPDWWNGRKWDKPMKVLVSGWTAQAVRDTTQLHLMGELGDWGTGALPKECIDFNNILKYSQPSQAIDTVRVKHKNGHWNTILFRNYEQGHEKIMGQAFDLAWLDEQCKDEYYNQALTRLLDKKGLMINTFTPEMGLTLRLGNILDSREKDQKLIRATWDDAPHLDKDAREALLKKYSPNEREMRSKGIPFFGSGNVFDIPSDDIRVDPFPIPDYWPRLGAIDFGWTHPTAVVWVAHDPETDTIYIYDCYKQEKLKIADHAVEIKKRGPIQIVWPHDGYKHETGSGVQIADQYRNCGVKMLYKHFTNPPVPGEKSGNIRVEPGISTMNQWFQEGNLKVFSNLHEWFHEYSIYHRDKVGKIVALDDDLMSATRYAVIMCHRHARRLPLYKSQKIDYPDLGLV